MHRDWNGMSRTTTSSSYPSSLGKLVKLNVSGVSMSPKAAAMRRGVSLSPGESRSAPRARSSPRAARSAPSRLTSCCFEWPSRRVISVCGRYPFPEDSFITVSPGSLRPLRTQEDKAMSDTGRVEPDRLLRRRQLRPRPSRADGARQRVDVVGAVVAAPVDEERRGAGDAAEVGALHVLGDPVRPHAVLQVLGEASHVEPESLGVRDQIRRPQCVLVL